MRDPEVDCFLDRCWIEVWARCAAVHFREAAGIPEFGREIAVGFDKLWGQFDVVPLRRRARKREAKGVCTKVVDDTERIDDITFRLRHLRALLVTNKAVDVDRRERNNLS